METAELKPNDDRSIIKPSPFVKWVGGKRSLLDEIVPNFPKDFNHYYEPFLGGGAVFFAVSERVKTTTISDINFELVITYKAIQKDPKALIEKLLTHQKNNTEDYYYEMRKQESNDPIDIAARFIYLNKTCYNGLYRVNKQGKFNVPMGRYANPQIIREGNIMACHKALEDVEIRYAHFEEIKPEEGSFVYCDPPYHPTDEHSFTQYNKSDFTEKDQTRLRDYLRGLTKKGVNIMLSNSDTKYIRDLYKSKEFHKNVVSAPRLVNCKPNQRESVNELLITNYPITIRCNPEKRPTTQESNLKSLSITD